LLVTGMWDGLPNNHLPPEENWSRAFIAVLPRGGFADLRIEPRAFDTLRDVTVR
jgi:hypothetical protein